MLGRSLDDWRDDLRTLAGADHRLRRGLRHLVAGDL